MFEVLQIDRRSVEAIANKHQPQGDEQEGQAGKGQGRQRVCEAANDLARHCQAHRGPGRRYPGPTERPGAKTCPATARARDRADGIATFE